jgi:hypothetical protein
MMRREHWRSQKFDAIEMAAEIAAMGAFEDSSPQSLTYECGVEHACELKRVHRIMRYLVKRAPLWR